MEEIWILFKRLIKYSYYMIQQYHFRVYIQRKWNKYVHYISSLPCSLQHYHATKSWKHLECPLMNKCSKKI